MKNSRIIQIEETQSTNTYIKECLNECELEDGFTVFADFQSAGKGQRGNVWESEKEKNLTFSTLLYPKNLHASLQFILSQTISLSIKEVLDKKCEDITIKWPNDIYWQERKIAGILIENDLMEDQIFRSIIGIGLNLNQETFRSDAPNPISLKQITRKNYSRKNILKEILLAFDKHLYQAKHSPKIIRESYNNSLFRKHIIHAFRDTNGLFDAQIIEVEPSGLLVLKTKKGVYKKYAFKEVQYII